MAESKPRAKRAATKTAAPKKPTTRKVTPKKTTEVAETKPVEVVNNEVVVETKKDILSKKRDSLIDSIDEISLQNKPVDGEVTTPSNPENLLNTSNDKKNVEWLENQLDVLTNENSKLINERDVAVDNYNKLLSNSGGSVNDGELTNQVLSVYNHFFSIARKMYKKHGWTNTNIPSSELISKFKETFSFIK